MKFRTRVLIFVAAASLVLAAQAAIAAPAVDPESAALQNEIEAIRRDYELRLKAVEDRLKAAVPQAAALETPVGLEEDDTESDQTSLPVAETQAEAKADATFFSAAYDRFEQTFNPKISAILQGRASYYSNGESDRSIPGFLLGDETGRGSEGLALGESELVFSANVDDKLYGFFDVSFDQDDIGIEEAYLSTLALPFGFGLKAGQFLSAIGYQNDRHSHTWDFIDQPLVYEAMLNSSLSDPGLQISWIAPTDLYIEFGGEILRGDAFPAAGAGNHGFGSATIFAKLSGDLGDSQSWQTGLSYLRADSDGRDSDDGNGGSVSFDGTTDLIIADFVWKWAPLGNFRERNCTFQTEYIYSHESGDLKSDGTTGSFRGDGQGFYVQGVYQFMPRWRVGLRYGQLWSDNRVRGLPPNVLDRDFSSPRRTSAMVDFSNSEFSRFRLQYSFEAGGLGDDSLIFLQYIISIGSHGAHAF